MNWDLILLMTSLALFSYWINFVMGNPLADKVDTKAMLFSIPFFFSVRRLRKNHMLTDIVADQFHELGITSDDRTRQKLKHDHRVDLYMSGREYFTWEKVLLCSVCFHWWISLLAVIGMIAFNIFGARADLLLVVFLYLFNHLLIRKFF